MNEVVTMGRVNKITLRNKWDGKNRRKGPDNLSILLNILNLLSWMIFVAALGLFHYARPEVFYLTAMFHDVPVRTVWIESLKNWLLITLYFNVAVSMLTLFINQRRSKRASDHRRYNLVFLVLIVAAFLFATNT